MMSEILRLCDVSKRYRRGERSVQVLSEISLEVGAGEIVAVVGSPGAGKTTLLEVAAGMVRPDGGEVYLGEVELGSLSSRARERLWGNEIAWTDRGAPRLPWLIRDYVGLPLATGRRRGNREAREMAADALERVGVAGGAARRWEDLSDWERVLVALARAFVCGPKLALIDGLLDGLGRHKTQRAGDLLRELVDEAGCGVLLSVSDLDSALVADRVLMFERRGWLRLISGQPRGEGTVIEFPASAAGEARGSRTVG
jgi:predicted ABC-type transport system involved in lysophospholipase L1 biosynthesis ATPase subunit